MAVLLGFAACPARAQPDFYAVTRHDLAGRPGTIIRQEPLAGTVPRGAVAFRILYRSTGLHGEPVAVSAVLVAPADAPPPEGRPVVAWQHPTSGVDQACAPSLSPSVLQMIQGLPAMLRQGYAVVATDYPGLGTMGPHPYLVGVSEGHAVLDAVRAARNLPAAHAGDRFALWGHSQGGHATLFAAILARPYAPELHLAGIAAAAPATELQTLLKSDSATPDGRLFTALLLSSWSRVFDAALVRLVSRADIPAVMLLGRQCFDPPLDSQAQPPGAPMPDATFTLRRSLMATRPWRSLAARNTPGVTPAGVPVFLAQGGADTTIPPAMTAAYARRLCAAGRTVHTVEMPGVVHRLIARDTALAAVNWIADRFMGRPAPNDCPARQ